MVFSKRVHDFADFTALGLAVIAGILSLFLTQDKNAPVREVNALAD